MMSTLIRVARRSLIVVGALAAIVTVAPADSSPAASLDSVATIHEARLRKLHLVRPDLINYPIASDVLC